MNFPFNLYYIGLYSSILAAEKSDSLHESIYITILNSSELKSQAIFSDHLWNFQEGKAGFKFVQMKGQALSQGEITMK